jgi:hypothetical protein
VSRTRPRAGFSSFAPAPRAPATWPARRRAVPPRPPGQSKPGQPGVFAATLAASGFKGKGRLRPGCPSHQPLWVFSFFFSRECGVRGREKGAPPLCQAEEEQVEGQDAADARRPRLLSQGKERRPSALRKEPNRSKDSRVAAWNAYAAPPATPSRPRLHRRPDVRAAPILFTSSPP